MHAGSRNIAPKIADFHAASEVLPDEIIFCFLSSFSGFSNLLLDCAFITRQLNSNRYPTSIVQFQTQIVLYASVVQSSRLAHEAQHRRGLNVLIKDAHAGPYWSSIFLLCGLIKSLFVAVNLIIHLSVAEPSHRFAKY